MGPDFHDRLTGATGHPGTGRLVLGRWQLARDGSRVNGVPGNAGDYLVPSAGLTCRVLSPDGTDDHDGRFAAAQIPERRSDRFANIREIAKIAGGAHGSGSWSEYIRTSPLARGIDTTAEPSLLDHAIERLLPHLEHVCARPREQLTIEGERMPVSRARRVPTSAAAFLAAHPEDWERRTFRGVVPGRIQALFLEDNWDIYENQVAIHLVDQLVEYLGGRLDEVRRAEHEARDPKKLGGSDWRKTDRVYALWAQMIGELDAAQIEGSAQQTIAMLLKLYRRTRLLRGSALYRGLRRRPRIGRTLRDTNLLVHDPHYRRVAELWRALPTSRDGGRPPTEEELYRERQAYCRAFDEYALLLVCRALDDLDFHPSGDSMPHGQGTALVLNGPASQCLQLWREKDRTISLALEGVSESLRFVPLAAMLTANASEAPELIADLEAGETAMTMTRATTVVVYPGEPDERARLSRPLQTRALSPSCELSDGSPVRPRLLPVSPFDINSVERTGRAIRWWLATYSLLAYPPTIASSAPAIHEQLRREITPDWLRLDEKRRLRLIRSPRAPERTQFEGWLATQRGATQEKLRRTRGNQGNRRLADQQLKGLGDLEEKLEPQALADLLEPCLLCPVCGGKAGLDRSFEARTENTFWSTCPACETSWGLRLCGACRARYPVLHLNMSAGVEASSDFDPGDADWVDAQRGRDVLALPCQRPNRNADTYICADCGTCPDREAGRRSGCCRCAQ